MKRVIILRHAHKDGDDITVEGKRACEELARRIETIDLVFCSPSNRARKTAAIVSGRQPIDDERAMPPNFPDEVVDEIRRKQDEYELGIVQAIWEHDPHIYLAKIAGERMQQLVSETLEKLQDDQTALIVSHDGTMVALEKLLKKEDFAAKPDHSFKELSGFVVDENNSVTLFE